MDDLDLVVCAKGLAGQFSVLEDMLAWPAVAACVQQGHIAVVSDPVRVKTPYYIGKYQGGVAFFDAKGHYRPIGIDFVALAACWQHVPRRQHLLARALTRNGYQATECVVDATAGFGQDSMAMCQLGCQVIALERHPVLYTALHTAHQMACRQSPKISQLPLSFVQADSLLWLQDKCPDSVLVDVMYTADPERKALNKRRMRVLRSWVGDDQDAEKLFAVAHGCVKRQVLVKRPYNSVPLVALATKRCVRGESTRIDVYGRR